MLGEHNSSVTVKKDELLSTIRSNRQKHLEEWEEAHEGYAKALTKKLQTMLRQVKKKDFSTTEVRLREPTNHVKEYDRAIRMLEMSTGQEIEIDAKQFSRLVLDEWDWQRVFKETATLYKG